MGRDHFHIDAPAGATSLDLTYQFVSPTSGSQGRIVMTRQMLNLQWNAVVLYPAGYYASRIRVRPSLTLPNGWTGATALDGAQAQGATTHWAETALDVLVDSPIYAGQYFRQIDLDPGGVAPVHLNIIADRPDQLLATPEQQKKRNAIRSKVEALDKRRKTVDFTTAEQEYAWAERAMVPAVRDKFQPKVRAILELPENGRSAAQKRVLTQVFRKLDMTRHLTGGVANPFPFLALAHENVLVQRLELFLLARFGSLTAVGEYGAALRIVAVASLTTSTLTAVLLPHAAVNGQTKVGIRAYCRDVPGRVPVDRGRGAASGGRDRPWLRRPGGPSGSTARLAAGPRRVRRFRAGPVTIDGAKSGCSRLQ